MESIKQIAPRLGRTPTKRPPKLPSDDFAWLMGMLMGLSEARQTSLSEEGYAMYCRSLSGFDRVDLRAAIERFAMEPREAYRSAFPSLGDIAEACREEAQKRRVPKARYCGHCQAGRIRNAAGEVTLCRCCCPRCDNTGYLVVWRGKESRVEPCSCRESAA